MKNTLHCSRYQGFAIKQEKIVVVDALRSRKATTEPVFFTCSIRSPIGRARPSLLMMAP